MQSTAYYLGLPGQAVPTVDSNYSPTSMLPGHTGEASFSEEDSEVPTERLQDEIWRSGQSLGKEDLGKWSQNGIRDLYVHNEMDQTWRSMDFLPAVSPDWLWGHHEDLVFWSRCQSTASSEKALNTLLISSSPGQSPWERTLGPLGGRKEPQEDFRVLWQDLSCRLPFMQKLRSISWLLSGDC